MSLNDTLKCPGKDRTLQVIPEMIACPDCRNLVEIWTDESKRDPVCSSLVMMAGRAAETLSGTPCRRSGRKHHR